MKFPTLKKKYNVLWKVLGAVALLIIVSCSITIDSIVQPASITGGAVLPVTLNVTINSNSSQTSNFIVAVLVPKIWKCTQNTTITFTSDITTGPQSMTVIPAGTPCPNGNGLDWPTNLSTKIGNGGNLLSDYEWVAFSSNSAYTIGTNATVHVVVTIQTKTTTDNLLFKLGYCVANGSDGISDPAKFASFFPGCFQVNGIGDVIDFCNPQLSNIDPRTSFDNDIITVTFDGGVISTGLDTATAVYLCVGGVTTAGDSLQVCVQNDQTKMRALGLNKWQLDLWPRKLFNLSDNQHLARLAYFFTDATGNKKVGFAGGTEPFTYTFKCQ